MLRETFIKTQEVIMIKKQLKQAGILFLLAILLVVFMGGCAGTGKKAIWGDPQSGLILTYRMQDNQVLQYRTSSGQDQTVEIMGQSNTNKSSSSLKFSVKSKGLKENNLVLGITVDDMKIAVKSMMGDMTPDMKSVIGKDFEMTLSSLGKEIKLSGAKSLTYSLGMLGDRNIDSAFKSIFPDLSNKPVKIGESWTTKEVVKDEGGGMNVTVAMENINTLEGLETVNGMECVKIVSKATGTLSGEGQQGGQELTVKGEIKGSSTWYFAYKEGVFVKSTGQSTSKGSVEVVAQNMTLPMTSVSKSEISLIK